MALTSINVFIQITKKRTVDKVQPLEPKWQFLDSKGNVICSQVEKRPFTDDFQWGSQPDPEVLGGVQTLHPKRGTSS